VTLSKICSANMTFQVELTPLAEAQIERTYRWYRERNPDFA
jgi:plasmid stabilization system protein ParE